MDKNLVNALTGFMVNDVRRDHLTKYIVWELSDGTINKLVVSYNLCWLFTIVTADWSDEDYEGHIEDDTIEACMPHYIDAAQNFLARHIKNERAKALREKKKKKELA